MFVVFASAAVPKSWWSTVTAMRIAPLRRATDPNSIGRQTDPTHLARAPIAEHAHQGECLRIGGIDTCHLRDLLSAPIMINHDRIPANMATPAMVAPLPTSVGR
jgi:hypothetical protein